MDSNTYIYTGCAECGHIKPRLAQGVTRWHWEECEHCNSGILPELYESYADAKRSVELLQAENDAIHNERTYGAYYD